MLYMVKGVFLIFFLMGASLALGGCSLTASLSNTLESLAGADSDNISFIDVTNTLNNRYDNNKRFKLTFSEDIVPSSLSTSDFTQLGSAKNVSISVIPTANPKEYFIHAATTYGSGTIQLKLHSESVTYSSGRLNGTSTSDSTITTIGSSIGRIGTAEANNCYIDSIENIRCYGNQYGGQLGIGSFNIDQYRGLPVTATNIPGGTKFKRVVSGEYSGCGLGDNGIPYCWGDNYRYELGAGLSSNSIYIPTPVNLSMLTGEQKVVDLSLRQETLCLVSTDQDLYCAGAFYSDSNSIGYHRKIDLSTLTTETKKVAKIEVGRKFFCGLTTSSEIFCAGENTVGQLGIGTTVSSLVPTTIDLTNITGSKKFVGIATSSSSACAISVEGKMYCWGDGSYGQIGNAALGDVTIPTEVSTINLGAPDYFTRVFGSHRGFCGLTNVGELYCWGNNWFGFTGNNSYATTSVPTKINQSMFSVGEYIVDVDTKDGRVCAQTNISKVYCWGSGAYSLTTFKVKPSYEPIEFSTSVLPGGQYWASISMDDAFKKGAYLLSSDGTLYYYGDGVPGISGSGHNVPTQADVSTVTGSTKFKKVSAGTYVVCAINNDDIVHCMGGGPSVGQGGSITSQTTLKAVSTAGMTGATTFSDIDLGQNVACGVATDGKGYCWGGSLSSPTLYNSALGNGSSTTRYQPHPISVASIPGAKTFQKIVVANSFHVCGLMTDNVVYCWGNSYYGRNGNNSSTAVYTPTLLDTSGMTGATTFSDIWGSNNTFCGTSTDNKVYCWGDSRNGQLGNGTTTTSNTPLPITTTNVVGTYSPTKVKAMNDFSCGILDNLLNIYCWGAPGPSILMESESHIPVIVDKSLMVGNPIEIYGGSDLFVKTDANKLYCIGYDCNFELARPIPTLQFWDGW